jgi:thiamine-monophosphate kinase
MIPISQIGEQGLIQNIRRWCRAKTPNGVQVLVPNGDDAFAARFPKNMPLVFTTDTMVEGTHFDLRLAQEFLTPKAAWEALGHKAMASNLSDLAAMGNVRPVLAFVTVGLCGDIFVDCVDRLFTGMRNLLGKSGGIIAGGDIIHSEKSIVSITLVGISTNSNLKCRSKVKSGQILMASGPLGLSMAGLLILSGRLQTSPKDARFLIRKHLLPEPRLKESAKIAEMVSGMMDTSDDLVSSLEILSKESGVGFDIDADKIPVHPALKNLHVPALRFVLSGGEDYELLFTADKKNVPGILKRIPSAFILGEVTAKKNGIRILSGGKPIRFKDARFKHF